MPPGSNMLRLAYADSGSACKLAGVQIIPLPTVANQILARTFFRSVANSLASPAVGKFSRASSAGGRRHLQQNFVSRIVSVNGTCRATVSDDAGTYERDICTRGARFVEVMRGYVSSKPKIRHHGAQYAQAYMVGYRPDPIN